MTETNPDRVDRPAEPENSTQMVVLRRLFNGEHDRVSTPVCGKSNEYNVRTNMLSESDRTALAVAGFDIDTIHCHDRIENREDGEEATAHLSVTVFDREGGR